MKNIYHNFSRLVALVFCLYLPTQMAISAEISSLGGAKISYFTNPPENSIVYINKGRKVGIYEGQNLLTFRLKNQINSSIKIPTGKIKIIRSNNDYSLAKVEESTHPLAEYSLPDYSQMMSGDFIGRHEITLAKKMELIKNVSLSYFELFEDPKSSPKSFEVSEKGLINLEKVAKYLSSKRFSRLIIKGYTDYRGASSDNQIESYQRALTIKQILLDRYGFDANRVVAVGLGETEDKDSSYVSGFERVNRRIEFSITTVL